MFVHCSSHFLLYSETEFVWFIYILDIIWLVGTGNVCGCSMQLLDARSSVGQTTELKLKTMLLTHSTLIYLSINCLIKHCWLHLHNCICMMIESPGLCYSFVVSTVGLDRNNWIGCDCDPLVSAIQHLPLLPIHIFLLVSFPSLLSFLPTKTN